MKQTVFTEAELEAARLARNAAAREWRQKNPDKLKAINTRYYLKKARREGLYE